MSKKDNLDNQIQELISMLDTKNYSLVLKRSRPLLKNNKGSFLLHHIVGLASLHTERYEYALSCFKRMVEIDKKSAIANLLVTNTYLNLQKYLSAESWAKATLNLAPKNEDALIYLSVALIELNKLQEAQEILSRAASLNDKNIQILINLGVVNHKLGKLDEAVVNFESALKLNACSLDAHFNLGNLLRDKKEFEKAEKHFQSAIKLNPNNIHVLTNLGHMLQNLNRTDEAVGHFSELVRIDPNNVEGLVGLGWASMQKDNFGDAIFYFQRALAINPKLSDVQANLATAFGEIGEIRKSIRHNEIAVKLNPNLPEPLNNLGMAYAKLNDPIKSLEYHKKALDINPNYIGTKAKLIHQGQIVCDWTFYEKYEADIPNMGIGADPIPPFIGLALEDNPERQRLRSESFIKTIKGYTTGLPESQQLLIDQKIRIGFFSADFHDHATMYLAAGLFREIDRKKYEVFIYSYGETMHGKIHEELTLNADLFVNAAKMSNAEIIQHARSHNINVAIDMKGFTFQGRLDLFLERIAPIQISYLGYPGTVGALQIDYLIADEVLIPKQHRNSYCEKIIFLPNSYQPNDNKRQIETYCDFPYNKRSNDDLIKFCCFNNTYKITPLVFSIWMRTLSKFSNSILWLFKSNKFAEANLCEAAKKSGVDPARIIFADRVSHHKHLGRIGVADLFLDTFPVNAHTTASDALWAGVPVLTMAGKQFAARVGASLLNATGLHELITESPEEYEKTLCKLAADIGKLRDLKQNILLNKNHFALFDTERYARHFESAIDKVVEQKTSGISGDIFVPRKYGAAM